MKKPIISNQPEFAWLNGEIIPWESCVLHARTQGAFWGANAFEGVRAYWNEDQKELFVYRLNDHLVRLRASMKCLDMPVLYDDQYIVDSCVELLIANRFKEDIHIVISPYFGMGDNFDSLGYTEEVGMHITAIPLPRSPRYKKGVEAAISTWRRISDDSMPPRVKTGANYHNSRLAQHEAVRNGFGTAIFLNQRGTVAEAPGSCLMMYSNNELITPPGTSGVLEGITVDSITNLATHKLGIKSIKREIDRTELYLADEVFLCGTLVEVQSITSVDRKNIANGNPGELVKKIQSLYEDHVRLNPCDKHSLKTYDNVNLIKSKEGKRHDQYA